MDEYCELVNLFIDKLDILKDLTKIIKEYFYPIEIQKYITPKKVVYWRGKHTSGFYDGIRNKFWFNPQSAIIHKMENITQIQDYKVIEDEYCHHFYDDISEHPGNIFMSGSLEQLIFSLSNDLSIMTSDKLIDLLTFYYAREITDNFYTKIEFFQKNNLNIPDKFYNFYLINNKYIQVFEKGEIIKELSMILPYIA